MSATPSPPVPLPVATTLDDVVETIGTVVDWSIGASNRLGYFAALYKRITIAVRTAVAQDAFEDGPRMERFDVAFANRYFDALNGYFHPQRYPGPTRSWWTVFAAADTAKPILVQHLVAGVSAHIALDLGIAATQISPGPDLWTLHHDFDTINAVLAGQVNDVVSRLNQLSPALSDLYAVLAPSELFAINSVRAPCDDPDPRPGGRRAGGVGLRCARADHRVRGGHPRDRPTGKPGYRPEHPGPRRDRRRPGSAAPDHAVTAGRLTAPPGRAGRRCSGVWPRRGSGWGCCRAHSGSGCRSAW